MSSRASVKRHDPSTRSKMRASDRCCRHTLTSSLRASRRLVAQRNERHRTSTPRSPQDSLPKQIVARLSVKKNALRAERPPRRVAPLSQRTETRCELERPVSPTIACAFGGAKASPSASRDSRLAASPRRGATTTEPERFHAECACQGCRRHRRQRAALAPVFTPCGARRNATTSQTPFFSE